MTYLFQFSRPHIVELHPFIIFIGMPDDDDDVPPFRLATPARDFRAATSGRGTSYDVEF